VVDTGSGASSPPDADRAAAAAALARGDVTIRPVQRRQLFIGDVPVGNTFE
jgi:hypothetical protein